MHALVRSHICRYLTNTFEDKKGCLVRSRNAPPKSKSFEQKSFLTEVLKWCMEIKDLHIESYFQCMTMFANLHIIKILSFAFSLKWIQWCIEHYQHRRNRCMIERNTKFLYITWKYSGSPKDKSTKPSIHTAMMFQQ